MSIKSKILSVAVSGLAIVAFSTFASAQTSDSTAPQTTDAPQHERHEGFGKHGGGRGMHGGKFGMMDGFRDLNLTDAQKQQIHSIMEANRPDQTSFEQMKPLMDAKRNGTLTDDQKAQLKAFHEQQKAKMDAVHQQIMAVLTDDQKAQLEKNRQEREQKREQHRQMRQQNGQAPATAPTNN